jgi:class 3 adenylate cyclase
VLGSNVNLASRLCDVAKGMQILMTKAVVEEPHVKESVVYEALSPMQFKGFDELVEVFAVLGLKAP